MCCNCDTSRSFVCCVIRTRAMRKQLQEISTFPKFGQTANRRDALPTRSLPLADVRTQLEIPLALADYY
ncbi:unnamed protein product [Lasius platythorax]|uniref:Uncharacterized protein n=1 Tax=Lasius platythorax TaxID=488582 RepID=A0AAV2N7X6_9HYME